MAEEGKGIAAPSGREEIAAERTGGDRDTDWARYEGRFDRIDVAIRHATWIHLGFSGVLLIALVLLQGAASKGGDPLVAILTILIPWFGFVVSACVFMKVYSGLKHRRRLERQWKAIYPDCGPTPYGMEARSRGTVAFAPLAVIVLASVLLWFVLTLIPLVWHYIPNAKGHMYYPLLSIFYKGFSILLVPSVFIALAIFGSYESGEPPEE